MIYQQYQPRQERQERFEPLWNVPPRDMRGITMPSQRAIHEYERQMETEPSAASQIQ